jgi:hypothetical protein
MSALFPEPPGSATRVPKVADPTQPASANVPPTPPDLGRSNGSLDAAATQIAQAGSTISSRQVSSVAAPIAKSSLAPTLPPAHSTRRFGAAAPPVSKNNPPTSLDLGQSNGSLDAAKTQIAQAGSIISSRQVRSSATPIAKSSFGPTLPPAHSTRRFSAVAPPDTKNNAPAPPDFGQSDGSPDAAKTPTGQADWPTSVRQDRGTAATTAKILPAPALPAAHNTRHSGAAAPPDSDAEAARAAAASAQRNSLFHTREGTATESIPDLAMALGTMALPFGPSVTAQMAPRFAQRLLPKVLLPEFTGKTSAVLFTNEGQIVRFRSGSPSPKYNNYSSASHTEGKAAIWMRENDSSGGVLFHNHPGGTCGHCDLQARTLLPTNATLRVVPPAKAVATRRLAKTTIADYVGDTKIPKPPTVK